MKKCTEEIERVLNERFGKDSLIALATAIDNVPYVRTVDAYYENGSFYVLTHMSIRARAESRKRLLKPQES